ncbi:hypothetical protein RO3G_15225 [Rhizopus delemar RA 99-880]|uniref:Mitochondrial import inner membrane translocase subunit TIM50 n=1 Tax=Rhizopus delemar (strain RA 99-880 / ATCC MYA-4621 / FGSC 9543 / NRRL 43880) TaxID=246409 RepID=I1CPY4_RHIO9|nr:hypothetical protein RO3G_15225 [Rhizopus delemar RA 99-880]|eukprot:EIE90514.1 hypothetical protein RO3G_15225 [Rhizopus delemar RA 99-880]
MDQKVPSIKEEESVQEQQVLDTSSTHIIKNIQPTDTPPIPSPISPQSSKIIPNPDFIVPVEIDNQFHNVYVLKRPGVDEFMRKMGEKYEVVVFTASLAKDLSQLGRDLSSTLILDNSPASYIFHTSNAVPVSTWFNDPHDTELTDLVAFLDDLTMVDDVQSVLDNSIYTSTTTA